MNIQLTFIWNAYDTVAARTLTVAPSPPPVCGTFGQPEYYLVNDSVHPSKIPVMWRIDLTPAGTAAGAEGGCDSREFSYVQDPHHPDTYRKLVTFHPIRPCELPIWSPAHSGCVDRLTPNEFPVAHAGEVDLQYYGMMMGGLPNKPEKKLAALSVLSKLSGVSIGLVGVHLFPDGFIQPHTGGHLIFFYVRGLTAAESVMQWSKCLLVCEDEIVVVLNSEGEPEQAEKFLRTIVPVSADGTPLRKMGHPCPIEFKASAPPRRAPLPILPPPDLEGRGLTLPPPPPASASASAPRSPQPSKKGDGKRARKGSR